MSIEREENYSDNNIIYPLRKSREDDMMIKIVLYIVDVREDNIYENGK